MGECGCDITIRRCKLHADDVVLVLDRERANVLRSFLELTRDYKLDAYRHQTLVGVVNDVVRDIDRGGVPHS